MVVPQLRLGVIDHVVYMHLLRHSHLEGKRRLRFSIPWLAPEYQPFDMPDARSGSPVGCMRRCAAGGTEQARACGGGAVAARGSRSACAGQSRGTGTRGGRADRSDIEQVDFMKTIELRRTIHARERGRCFYCLRRVLHGWSASTMSCHGREWGAIRTATWSRRVWNATRRKESGQPRSICAGCFASTGWARRN